MIQVLKVLGRIFLIGFGLLCIVAGGLCAAIGVPQGLGAAWLVGGGIVLLLSGVALVRYIWGKWTREIPEEEKQ